MENKKAALDILLEKTLKVIELQEKHIKYSSRCEDHRVFAGTKTIKKFIEKNLVEQSSHDGTTKIMFVGNINICLICGNWKQRVKLKRW